MGDSNLSEYKDMIDVISKMVYREVKSRKQTSNDFSIPVEISNHHIHLTRDSLDVLFGKGYELTKFRDLSQPGEFASNERISIVGSNMRVIERVRILGPVREYTQAELSMTDGYFLGLDLPTRISGNLKGASPITFIGPKGTLYLKESAIRAARHIHMTLDDAMYYQVKNMDRVKVEVAGEHGIIYKDVIIRVSPECSLTLHLDTDEANAGNVKGTGLARIL